MVVFVFMKVITYVKFGENNAVSQARKLGKRGAGEEVSIVRVNNQLAFQNSTTISTIHMLTLTEHSFFAMPIIEA